MTEEEKIKKYIASGHEEIGAKAPFFLWGAPAAAARHASRVHV